MKKINKNAFIAAKYKKRRQKEKMDDFSCLWFYETTKIKGIK